MASLAKAKNGCYSIQFQLNGKRKTIYAGKMEPREADRLRDKIDHFAKIRNCRGRIEDSKYFAWLGEIAGTPLHSKMVKSGLLDPTKVAQLDRFICEYIASRTDIKERTRINLLASKRLIVEHFGGGKDLRKVSPADVSSFKAAMLTKYAPATVGRTLRRGRQFFAHALDAGLIQKNPFDKVKIPSQTNPKRLFFVTKEMTSKVMDTCPDRQSRLIFALARFGGLRVPGELIGLQWNDVLWDQNRMRVFSPKTEHLPGKDHRWIPLFPEIKEHLRECFEQAKDGEVFIFPKGITNSTNLRTKFYRILKMAGLSPWPKLFQNLRSSRETELCQNHPIHVVTSWIGNSPTVATAHYLQVTDLDWNKATLSTSELDGQIVGSPDSEKNSAKNDVTNAKILQKTMHRGGSQMFEDVQDLLKKPDILRVFKQFAAKNQNKKIPLTGIEPVTNGLENHCSIH